MFRTDLLSIIRSLNTVFTATGVCIIQLCCQSASEVGTEPTRQYGITRYADFRPDLASSQHNCMTYTSCCKYSLKTPGDGQ